MMPLCVRGKAVTFGSSHFMNIDYDLMMVRIRLPFSNAEYLNMSKENRYQISKSSRLIKSSVRATGIDEAQKAIAGLQSSNMVTSHKDRASCLPFFTES